MKRNIKTTETAPLTWKDAELILNVLKGKGDFSNLLMFGAGFYMGLRIGDILGLTWEQLETKPGESFTVNEQKTGKERVVTVHPDFAKLVELAKPHIKKRSGLVFQSKKTSKDGTKEMIGVHAANHRIKKVFAECGVITQNPSSHTLRKTFGKRVYEKNGKSEASLILLSKVFNHRDISITRRYIGLTKESISNAYLSL